MSKMFPSNWRDVVSWILSEVEPATLNDCLSQLAFDATEARTPLIEEYSDSDARLGALCFRLLRCQRASMIGFRTSTGLARNRRASIFEKLLSQAVERASQNASLTALYATCNESTDAYRTLQNVGFQHLGTLHQLCRVDLKAADDREWENPPSQPWTFHWTEHWSLELSNLIRATFEETLDLPSLSAEYAADEEGEIASQIGASDEYSGNLFVLTAQADAQAAGCLVLKIRGTLIDLCYLGVVPKFRRVGLAKRLLLEAERFCRRQLGSVDSSQSQRNSRHLKSPQWTTNVDASNRPALQLYYAFGFRELSTFALMERSVR